MCFESFQMFPKVRMYFGIGGLFCTINRYFVYRYLEHVFEHLQKMSQKCEQFPYGPFVWDVLGFGVLNGPLTKKIQNTLKIQKTFQLIQPSQTNKTIKRKPTYNFYYISNFHNSWYIYFVYFVYFIYFVCVFIYVGPFARVD